MQAAVEGCDISVTEERCKREEEDLPLCLTLDRKRQCQHHLRDIEATRAEDEHNDMNKLVKAHVLDIASGTQVLRAVWYTQPD